MGWVVNAVSTRYRKALSGATLSTAAFESISSSASPESVNVWTAEEEYAQSERSHDVKVMDIYDIKKKPCEFGLLCNIFCLTSCFSPIPCRNTSRADREGNRHLWP
jgi:hypothetical protein